MKTFSLSIALFFLRLFSNFLSCSAQETSMQQFMDAKCVDDIKNKFPEYLLRFKEGLINWACRNSRNWRDDARNGEGNPRFPKDADAGNLLQEFGKATRKEVRALTEEERRRFFMALHTLKTDKINGWTKYDILTLYHKPEYAPGAHFGAASLPFHREFLKNMEIAMRLVDPGVGLPYWDSTLDSALPNPADSILWTDDFFGNGNGEVTSGPFSNWTTIPDQQIADLSPNKRIVRVLGQSPRGSLFKQSDVDTIMSKPNYRNLVFCVDPFFEMTIRATHSWVGGHMAELRIAPNDPVFFVVHAWADHLWEIWRTTHQNAQTRQSEFVPNVNETCNEFSTIDYPLKPYSQLKVRDGLSNNYTDQIYNYEVRPTCKNQCQNSSYLFCDASSSRCLSKIRRNGNCTGFEGRDSCYRGICTRGICVPFSPSDNSSLSTEIFRLFHVHQQD